MLEPAIIGLSYAVGAINGAYYYVRLRTGHDIRAIGSGTAGARNAGRVLGKAAFVIIFSWDALKGAGAVGLARIAEVSPIVVGLATIAVVAGHIWPPQLRFRGGKGLATAFGALLALGFPIIIGGALLLVPAFALTRQVTKAVLLALALTPLAALWWRGWGLEVAVTAVVAGLVVFAHIRRRSRLPSRLPASGASHTGAAG